MSKAHFIGIAGVGMSATALILKDLGWKISGSDEGFYPPTSTNLETWKLPCIPKYAPENIPADADLIVIGKHAKLIPEDLPGQAGNAEVRAALDSGKPIKSFPEILEDVFREKQNIVVAGSYGKSTCTALAAWCLMQAGKDPSYFIGAAPIGFSAHGHLGRDLISILEGDEYPASNWDHRSKFLLMHPKTLLLTSLSHDHVNIFPTFEDYIKPFRELVMMLPKDGLLIANAENKIMRELLDISPARTTTYSIDGDTEWKAADTILFGRESSFSLIRNNKKLITLQTSLLGRHNIENIVGIAALLLSKNLLTPHELAHGVETFKGLRRRLDCLTKNSLVPVYEGFGSSYDKAKSAIEAIKLHFPQKKLFVIFEPHTFSWRKRETIHWYDNVFSGVHRVVIYKPPTHGADTHAQLSLSEILEYTKSKGAYTVGIEKPNDVFSILDREISSDSIVLLLTSGDLDGLITKIPEWADKKFPLTHAL